MTLSRRTKIAVSIILAVAMISTSFVVFGNYHGENTGGTATFGPKIVFSLANPGNTPASANVTEAIQIMGIDPSYLWSGGFSTPGGTTLPPQAQITLFNESYFPSQSGIRNMIEFMNANFSKILAGWQSYYQIEGNNKQSVSLELECTLSVLINGNLSVYSYYNNLPFNASGMILERYVQNANSTSGSWFNDTSVNPSDYSSIYFIPRAFNVTPSFDLASPTYATAINSTTAHGTSSPSGYSPDRIIGLCRPDGTWYLLNWTKTLHGPDPLMTVHINGRYPPENNFLAIVGSIATSTADIAMNSDQTGVTAGGSVTDQMSTSPSWSGNGNFTAGGSIAQWSAYPDNSYAGNGGRTNINNTSAFIYLSNTTFTITNYNVVYFWGYPYNCQEKYLGNTSSIQISAVNSTDGNYKLGYGFVSIYFYYALQNLTKSSASTNLGTLAGGQEIQGGQIWGKTTGYSNASGVYQKEEKVLNTFASALGVAVAAIDVAAAANGFLESGEAAVVTASLRLIAASLGLADTLLADFSTISFSTSSDFVSNLYAITNEPFGNGYAYNLTDFQSPNPVTFNLNGNSYQFTAPSNFIVAT